VKSFIRRLLRSTSPRQTGVPAVVSDGAGAEVRFSDREPWRIEWVALTEVGVHVVVGSEGNYSEAFWKLSGRTEEEGFEVPVEFVAGSETFKDRLFDLPGFDPAPYIRARKAEARAESGYFVCWQREPAGDG
jgi:hypothetical protein